MRTLLYLSIPFLLLSGLTSTASAQVSNDNEDGVNKIDSRYATNFVPGQVLLKMKDDSPVQIRRNAKGKYQSAGITQLDNLLREFDVDDLEKLFPTAKPKPKAQLRKKIAPNGNIVQEKNLDKIFLVKTGLVSTDSTMHLIKRLKELPDVEYAEPNYYAYISSNMASSLPEDYTPARQQVLKASVSTETTASMICSNPSQNPMYTQQYGITQQNIQQLWNKPIINKKRPVIAILDTGVDINHPDLKDNIWQNTKEVGGISAYDDDGNGIVDDKYGWNFVEDYYDLTDRCGHGTHCAGIAAAADNGIGIVGANPLALIMPVKVLSDSGSGDVATISRGIVYAAENGADVISMSLGGYGFSNAEKDALDMAYQTAVLVAAAGNDGQSIYDKPAPFYPAAYYLVLGVEASDSNGQRAMFSNYDPDGPIFSEEGIEGCNYEIQVPGVGIYSTLPNGQYNQLSGTSMSTPLFAGAVSALQMVKEYSSKDVLYADLIHLKADFAKIYSDQTPRIPKLDIVSINIDDNVDGNTNIDGQVDVGETILFTPVLRNTWADATGIRLKLTVDPFYASFVEIENPEVDFGYSISAYGMASAETPFSVQFANNIGDNTRIKFVLEVSCSESPEGFFQEVFITVNNMVKISGLLSEDRTLTANHVYYVNEDLGIPKGITLTIEPGTRLEFGEGVELASFGKLSANGAPGKPIVFTGHRDAKWGGIRTHDTEVSHVHHGLYTNESQTLFTFLSSNATPLQTPYVFTQNVWYNSQIEASPQRFFGLSDEALQELGLVSGVFDGSSLTCVNGKLDQLTDPKLLTPAVLQLKQEMMDYYNSLPDEYKSYSEAKPDQTYICCDIYGFYWFISDNPRDTISYCRIEGGECDVYLKDCFVKARNGQTNKYGAYSSPYFDGYRNIITGFHPGSVGSLKLSNIINNIEDGTKNSWESSGLAAYLPSYSELNQNNYVNNIYYNVDYDNHIYHGKPYWLAINSSQPEIDRAKYPSYLGTSREDIVRPHIWEIGNASGKVYGYIDLSNMPTRPYAEAHGIVWKVCVNGKDAQDEYEDLAPLGVGRHKFEVYFNRPMNKAAIPEISFGVREPYNQHTVAEDGSWNEEGTIYTAYFTITGKTMSDGVCRIYVRGAEDDEFFECPYEKDRFNINVQAAGSMATGFSAEVGVNKVCLSWNNENNDFEDVMGFNVYRYNMEERLMPVLDAWGSQESEMNEYGEYVPKYELRLVPTDTITLNSEVLDVSTSSYTDYNVVPGETYYYYYKVLSTDLRECNVSNVVSATPVTAKLGDANGSGNVDVADVITTVNYASGLQPKPFIFEAADMNADQFINILDIIGIIKTILNPEATMSSAEATATYTVEDGILYVESPVALAGVQVQLALDGRCKMEDVRVAEDLNGFEQASAWLSDYDYLFLAYNINGQTLSPGKHALLHIGSGLIGQMYLSDAAGHNVEVIGDDATKVNRMASDVMNVPGIYDLKGRKLTGNSTQESKLPKGVYIINGRKVVK